jgi:hypothetical protein
MMIRRCFRVLGLCLAVLALLTAAVLAAGEEPPFAAVIDVPGLGEVEIPVQQTERGDCLFLPSAARPEAFVLRFSGETALLSGEKGSLTVESGVPFSLLPLLAGEGEGCPLTFENGETRLSFTLLRSGSLGSAWLTSSDREQGRSYVEEDKERKVKGVSFALLRADGTPVWAGELKNIKGRGNSTWSYPKKPYQIKLSEKADLLETGEAAEKETTWVLLADYADESLLRNRLTFDLAADFGLPYTPHSRSVDLYYDGEYRGVYELCEKTEISKGRVAIRDLEGEIEDVNPEIGDFALLPGAEGTLPGVVYHYTPDLAAPEDLRGGYLLELDYPNRSMEEAAWFSTEGGQYITVKSPEYLPEEAMIYIADLFQRFERAVMAGGTDPVTGADYRDLCDPDSLARCFLILELSMDNDAFLSSTYFYKPPEEEKLYAGPLWDFDTGYGVSLLPADTAVTLSSRFGRSLLRIPSFREALLDCWQELEPRVKDILLSADPAAAGLRLRSLAGYDGEIAASRRMDRALWGRPASETAAEDLHSFLLRRTVWLDERLEAWAGGDVPYWTFEDVTPERWFFSAVEFAAERGLITVGTSLRYQPYQAMNRAMSVTLLHRLMGAPTPEKRAPFRDVPPDVWYASAVAWAAETGVTRGVNAALFAPNAKVTREAFITMLYRCLLTAGVPLEEGADLSAFSDGEEVHPWAREAVAWAVGSGVLQGIGGKLEPGGETNRAQAAAVAERVCRTILDPLEE